MRYNKFLSESFTQGTIMPKRIYAVPFSTTYSDNIDRIIASYPYGTLKAGIYSNDITSPSLDYPDSLVLDLGAPTFYGNQAVFEVNAVYTRGDYWLVCFIDREAPFLGDAIIEHNMPIASRIFNPYTNESGKGFVKEYNSGSLPASYPTGASIIPNKDFAPFFFISVSGY